MNNISETKHLPLLDGLRGVAAFIVICYHIFEAYAIDPVQQGVNHGYLAVDFFFMLSGFVLAHAYDKRINTVSSLGFIKRRIVRLQPMVVLGAIIGASLFYFQDYKEWHVELVSLSTLLFYTLLSALMIPALPDSGIRNLGEMYPLNGPTWSLFFEYIGSLVYIYELRKASKLVVILLTCVFGVCLVRTAFMGEYAYLGWGWTLDADNFFGGMSRLLFAFTLGVLLSRTLKPAKVKHSFVLASVILVVVTFLPNVGGTQYNYLNGIYDVFCIAVVFPFIIYLGISEHETGAKTSAISRWFGRMSYPIYIVHYPIIYVYYSWVKNNNISVFYSVPGMIAVVSASVVVAYLSVRFYDEPIRKRLTKRFIAKK